MAKARSNGAGQKLKISLIFSDFKNKKSHEISVFKRKISCDFVNSGLFAQLRSRCLLSLRHLVAQQTASHPCWGSKTVRWTVLADTLK